MPLIKHSARPPLTDQATSFETLPPGFVEWTAGFGVLFITVLTVAPLNCRTRKDPSPYAMQYINDCLAVSRLLPPMKTPYGCGCPERTPMSVSLNDALTMKSPVAVLAGFQ